MRPPKQTQFHTPAISSNRSPAQHTPPTRLNVSDIRGHKRSFRAKESKHNTVPCLQPAKQAPGSSLMHPLNGYRKRSSNEQEAKRNRATAGISPRMVKLHHWSLTAPQLDSSKPHHCTKSTPQLPQPYPPCITLIEHEQEFNRCKFLGVSMRKIGDYNINDLSYRD